MPASAACAGWCGNCAHCLCQQPPCRPCSNCPPPPCAPTRRRPRLLPASCLSCFQKVFLFLFDCPVRPAVLAPSSLQLSQPKLQTPAKAIDCPIRSNTPLPAHPFISSIPPALSDYNLIAPHPNTTPEHNHSPAPPRALPNHLAHHPPTPHHHAIAAPVQRPLVQLRASDIRDFVPPPPTKHLVQARNLLHGSCGATSRSLQVKHLAEEGRVLQVRCAPQGFRRQPASPVLPTPPKTPADRSLSLRTALRCPRLTVGGSLTRFSCMYTLSASPL